MRHLLPWYIASTFQVWWTIADMFQRCAMVDVDSNLLVDSSLNGIKAQCLEYIDKVARFTGTDVFLLKARAADAEDLSSSIHETDQSLDQRLRIAIYGDPESSEHAKTRILIMIDQIVGLFRLPRILCLLTWNTA